MPALAHPCTSDALLVHGHTGPSYTGCPRAVAASTLVLLLHPRAVTTGRPSCTRCSVLLLQLGSTARN